MITPHMRAKLYIPSNIMNVVIVSVLYKPVGNLHGVFDINMKMSAHVSTIIISANHHLRNIEKMIHFLNNVITKSAIISLVTSRLAYRNVLLCGITVEVLWRLQRV